MQRILSAWVALLVLLSWPVAAAEEEPSKDDPYYARIDIHPPSAPGAYDDKRDCARDQKPVGYQHGRPTGLEQVRPPINDYGGLSLAHTMPRCLVLDQAYRSSVCLPDACRTFFANGHASYNVTSGDYSVQATWLLPEGVAAPPHATMGASGNTGIGLLFDCEYCPPPGG